jgi:prevent-host-death family protein
MKNQIAIFDAKQKLSELVVRANDGETFVITRHGAPMAKLVPVEPQVDREEAKRRLFERLRSQPSLNLPKVTRDEIYDCATGIVSDEF